MSMTGLYITVRLQAMERERIQQGRNRRLRLQQHRKARCQRVVDCSVRKQRLRQGEDDLGAMLLLAAGVRGALLAAGVLDRTDLVEAIRRMDLADGVADGRLTPAATRPAPKPRLSTEEFLKQLAEKDGS